MAADTNKMAAHTGPRPSLSLASITRKARGYDRSILLLPTRPESVAEMRGPDLQRCIL